MMEHQVNEMKGRYYQYDAFLQNEARLSTVRDMYDLLFFMLPLWLKLDLQILKNNIIEGYKVLPAACTIISFNTV